MSANSAVTVLRSPSGMSPTAGSAVRLIADTAATLSGAAPVDGAAPPAKTVPHSPQNFAPGALSNPHFAQRAFSGDPHWLQTFSPWGFSVPQLAQRMCPSCSVTQLIEQRLGVLEVGGVKALGEPAVDFGKHRASLVATALLREQPGEAPRPEPFPKP